MAILIRNLVIRVDESGTLEVTADEITVGMLAKQAKPFSVFNPGTGSDPPPPPPRHEERVTPEPQSRVSAAVPEPSPVAPDPVSQDGFVEPAKKTKEATDLFFPENSAIKRFVNADDKLTGRPTAKKKQGKRKNKAPVKLPPELHMTRHVYKPEGSNKYAPLPPELAAAQEIANRELAAQRAAFIQAATSQVHPRQPSRVWPRKYATREDAMAARRESNRKSRIKMKAIRDAKLTELEELEKLTSQPIHPQPELPQLAPPRPVPPPPPLPPATDTAGLLAAAKKKFGVPFGQIRPGDAPLAFP